MSLKTVYIVMFSLLLAACVELGNGEGEADPSSGSVAAAGGDGSTLRVSSVSTDPLSTNANGEPSSIPLECEGGLSCNFVITSDDCNAATIDENNNLVFTPPTNGATECTVTIIPVVDGEQGEPTTVTFNITPVTDGSGDSSGGGSSSFSLTSPFFDDPALRPVGVEDETYFELSEVATHVECKLPGAGSFTPCVPDGNRRVLFGPNVTAGTIEIRISEDATNWETASAAMHSYTTVSCDHNIESGSEPTYDGLITIVQSNNVVCFGDGTSIVNAAASGTASIVIPSTIANTLIARVGHEAIIENEKPNTIIDFEPQNNLDIVGLTFIANSVGISTDAIVVDPPAAAPTRIIGNTFLHRGTHSSFGDALQLDYNPSSYDVIGNTIRAFDGSSDPFSRGINFVRSLHQRSERNVITSKASGISFERWEGVSWSRNDTITSLTSWAIYMSAGFNHLMTVSDATISADRIGITMTSVLSSTTNPFVIEDNVIEAGEHGIELRAYNSASIDVTMTDNIIKRTSAAGSFSVLSILQNSSGVFNSINISGTTACTLSGTDWSTGAGGEVAIDDQVTGTPLITAWQAGTQTQINGACP